MRAAHLDSTSAYRRLMTDELNKQEQIEQADSSADVKAILVIFTAVILLAVHTVSGFSFDF